MIDVAKLIDCGVGPTQAKAHAPWLEFAAKRYRIVEPIDTAAWLAQCMHETTMFVNMEELLSYRSAQAIWNAFKRLRPLKMEGLQLLVRQPVMFANVAYALRNGNGNIASGDGWNFRGSGDMMLTGRANFAAAQGAIGRPYVAFPSLVRRPEDAALTAAWFWTRPGDHNDPRSCQQMMATVDFEATSTRINGATPANGAIERRSMYARNLAVFHP